MRKPRDYDAELKALEDKARQLKERKLQQLGELVIATRADALDAEILAGALLTAVETKDQQQREAWRKRGAAFFQGKVRERTTGKAGATDRRNSQSAEPRTSAAPPLPLLPGES